MLLLAWATPGCSSGAALGVDDGAASARQGDPPVADGVMPEHAPAEPGAAPGAAARPPNLVVLLADDLGAGELSLRGHPYVRTPRLDALARDGVDLRAFRAAAPVCSPTRASLLTGRHPARMGVLKWGHDLPPDERTLAEVLAARGWATGLFGKWHLGSVRAGEPTSPGAQGFTRWAAQPNFFDLDPALSVQGRVEPNAGEGSLVCIERALDFARAAVADGRPFFALVTFGSPHDPHVAEPAALSELEHVPEAMRAYVAEIEALDHAVGRLRDGLAELGVAEDTLIWFTSDNGPRPPDGGAASTGGLRGRKGSLWEGGLRVPSFVVWPHELPAGVVREVSSGTVDVAPTLAALAGAADGLRATLDGRDLLPVLRGDDLAGSSGADARAVASGDVERDAAENAGFSPSASRAGRGFWDVPAPGRAQHGDRILAALAAGEVHAEETPLDLSDVRARLASGARPGHAAWVAGWLKLHVRPGDGGDGGEAVVELYDLAADPTERRDLAGARPGDVQRMTAALRAWQDEVVADWLDVDGR